MNDNKRRIIVERRRHYGELIRLRNFALLSQTNLDNFYNSSSTSTTTSTMPITYSNRALEFTPHFTHTEYYTRSDYDNHHGLINKKLFKNSYVTKSCNKGFCVICQDDFDTDNVIRTLSCLHSFHINCVDEWFIDKNICPLCKFELT